MRDGIVRGRPLDAVPAKRHGRSADGPTLGARREGNVGDTAADRAGDRLPRRAVPVPDLAEDAERHAEIVGDDRKRGEHRVAGHGPQRPRAALKAVQRPLTLDRPRRSGGRGGQRIAVAWEGHRLPARPVPLVRTRPAGLRFVADGEPEAVLRHGNGHDQQRDHLLLDLPAAVLPAKEEAAVAWAAVHVDPAPTGDPGVVRVTDVDICEVLPRPVRVGNDGPRAGLPHVRLIARDRPSQVGVRDCDVAGRGRRTRVRHPRAERRDASRPGLHAVGRGRARGRERREGAGCDGGEERAATWQADRASVRHRGRSGALTERLGAR